MFSATGSSVLSLISTSFKITEEYFDKEKEYTVKAHYSKPSVLTIFVYYNKILLRVYYIERNLL